MTAPNELDAVDALAALAAGRLSCEALTRACLERIAVRDGVVRAFAYLDPERALAEAQTRDREGARGRLHGLPFGVKDIIDTHDMPTCYGSPIHAGHQPSADAACVALAREAGAVMIGKTVTTEFALRHPGPTANPRDLAHTPGGSSSGSAAAVADYMVPVAFGTQTGGSIIRPASYCGVVGYKPSFNTINPTGVKPLAGSFDTVGVFTRCVDDCALVVGVLAGDDRACGASRSRPPGAGWSLAHTRMATCRRGNDTRRSKPPRDGSRRMARSSRRSYCRRTSRAFSTRKATCCVSRPRAFSHSNERGTPTCFRLRAMQS